MHFKGEDKWFVCATGHYDKGLSRQSYMLRAVIYVKLSGSMQMYSTRSEDYRVFMSICFPPGNIKKQSQKTFQKIL